MKSATNIIVTDMDDTLIRQYGKPTKGIVEFWNSLQERSDMTLVVATGQQYTKVKDVFLSNGLTLPQYILSDQGTLIFDTQENVILKRFYLRNEDIIKVVDKFYELKGTPQFMRIYTGTVVIAYDCTQAKEFFAKTSQQNVIFGRDIDYVIKHGQYSKVILMAETHIANQLVLFASNNTKTIPMNTGKTSYGNCGFDRFEAVNSDKKIALLSLLETKFDFQSENNGGFKLLALGDEQSDYGLAQTAMSLNLYPGSAGHFAVVQSDSPGNLILREKLKDLSISLGMQDKIIFTGSVEQDGWITAVKQWLEAINS